MTFTTITLWLHDGDEPKTIADYVDGNGKFVNIGVIAYSALTKHEAIHFKDENGAEVFIPYHAVLAWTVAKAEGEYTKPEDDFCKEVVCQPTKTCDETEPTPDPDEPIEP